MAHDRRYLARHGNQWIVVVKVPDRLRKIVGRAHLKQSLHTDSLAIANRDKFRHVAEMKAELEAAERTLLRGAAGTSPLVSEALGWREMLVEADHEGTSSLDWDGQDDEVTERDRLELVLHDRAEEIAKREGVTRAKEFFDTASGKATPISPLIEKWLAERPMKPRQVLDYRCAATKFVAWLETNRLPMTVERCTRKIAGRYVTEAFVSVGINWRTANKDISCLSGFWRWLETKDYAQENVWARQSLAKVQPKKGDAKRPYTDDEIVRLFRGRPSDLLRDMMTIAALSGMRIEEIAKLTVGDIFDNRFDITEAKTPAGIRMVPIHPGLLEIVARRTKGKGASDPLFPELPVPKPGSAVERSQKVVKAFTAYRRKMKVDDVPKGSRQSRVDFHSFRRWFITKAEQAGNRENFIASLVGHKRTGETLGRYSAGPLVQQIREVVESVHLPVAHETPSPVD
ncbi:tyrosine-type recombinase/integrase [Aureimonas sp. D3]|uniref:tyrosine-type recombinase/integrase n=1 Tax=Aureimonas sp. D3 TaxID=1638164 RepID=UPI0009EC966F|nr:tyrosine-type recombinase/integrase [Aureimonas sp. D3]